VTTIDVPELADTDLDHHGPEFRDHNYELMADLRDRCPVAKSSAWGGFWLFTSYDSIFDACQEPSLFGNHLDRCCRTQR
jgi:cytochrome P450